MHIIIQPRQIAALLLVPRLSGYAIGAMSGAFITGAASGLFFVAAMAGVVVILRSECRHAMRIFDAQHRRAMVEMREFKAQIERDLEARKP